MSTPNRAVADYREHNTTPQLLDLIIFRYLDANKKVVHHSK